MFILLLTGWQVAEGKTRILSLRNMVLQMFSTSNKKNKRYICVY